MKKLLAFILVITFVLSLTACNLGGTQEETFQVVSNSAPNDLVQEESKSQEVSSSAVESSFVVESKLEHVHVYAEATCTAPATCSCGETKGKAKGHKWVEATYTAPKTCSVCQKTTGEKLVRKVVPADFVGKTIRDVENHFGKQYELEYYEGSTVVYYQQKELGFLLGGYFDTPSDSVKITCVMGLGNETVIDSLAGAMTYPQVVAAVGNKVSLEQPEKWYNEMDGCWQYTLGFGYSGYAVTYNWYEDPNTNPSAHVLVSNVVKHS